jgi:hypothetical protein
MIQALLPFSRTIGIDYSGAETANSSLKGLRVYQVDGKGAPYEVAPPPSPKKYWTRRGIAEWLVERLAEDIPTIVGIDHGFSFPLRPHFVSSRFTGFCLTGPNFLTTSNGTGRPMLITHTSTLCATVPSAMELHGREARAGVA